MNEFYRSKLNELLSEFNRYLAEHLAFVENIPNGAEVVLLDKRDPAYNWYVLSAIKTDHEIIYVDVGDLAPIKSRLKRPKVVTSPRAYAGKESRRLEVIQPLLFNIASQLIFPGHVCLLLETGIPQV